MAREKVNPPKRRRWPRRILFLPIILALCAAALNTTMAQRALLLYVVEHFLDVGVRVQEIRFGFTKAVLSRMEVYDRGTDEKHPPLIAFDELNLAYQLRPNDGRYIDNLYLRRPHLTWDGRQTANTNYGFVTTLLGAPSSGLDLLPYIPKKLQADQIALDVAMPTWKLRLDALSAVGSLPLLTEGVFLFEGDPVTVAWAVGGPGAIEETLSGSINLQVSSAAGIFRGSARIALPGIVQLDATGQAELLDATKRFSMDIEQLLLKGTVWNKVTSKLLPIPLHFDQFRVGESRINGVLNENALAVFEGYLEADADRFIVGASEAPLYAGPLHLSGRGRFEQELQLRLEARLNREQQIWITFASEHDGGNAELRINNWTREQLEASLPAEYRDILSLASGIRGISAHATTEVRLPDYMIDAAFIPKLAISNAVRLTLKGSGTLETPSGPTFDGSVRMASEGDFSGDEKNESWGAAELGLRIKSATSFATKTKLQDFHLQAWSGAWMGPDFVAPFDAVLTGLIQLEPAKNEGYSVVMDLSADRIAYAEWPAPADTTLTTKGKMILSQDFASAHGASLDTMLGNIGHIALRDWRFERNPLHLEAHLNGALDLEYLAEWLGLENVWGDVSFDAPVRMTDPTILKTALTLTTETLNVGTIATPYGVSLTLMGDLALNLSSLNLSSPTFSLQLGDDTRLVFVELRAAVETESGLPRIRAESVTLESSLAPLISLDYLASANSHISVEAHSLEYHGNHMTVALAFNLTGSSLVFAGKSADVRGVNFVGDLRYDQGLTGGGVFEADALTAGGVTLWRLHGNTHVQGETLHIENLSARLFGGIIEATAKIQLFEPNMSMHVATKVEGLDLEVFTEEFAPANTKLTGVASGDFEIAVSGGELEDVQVQLRTGAGFTINRAIVEEQLRTQDFGGMSDRALDRIIRGFLGDADPVPFDAARLKMGLQGGRLVGQVTLVSDRPKITFAIHADLEAIIQVMKVHQQTRIEGLDEP